MGEVDPQRVKGAAFSILLLLVAGCMIYKGIELTRFDFLHRAIGSSSLTDVRKQPSAAELTALQDSADAWRETVGVRFLARADYQTLGKALHQEPSTSLANAVEILKVDPVNAEPWLDIAEASWADPNARALSFGAWAMSSVIAPRELAALQRRIVFLLAVWPEASDAQKRRMFFEVDSVLGKPNLMRRQWRLILASLSPDRRQEVEDAFRAYNPAYRR